MDLGSCPLPLPADGKVQLAHGSGGKLTQQLVESIFYRHWGNPYLNQKHDATTLPFPAGKLAITTDSYVVSPIFFPGGDIGTLAVNGTINDLAMSGAKPLYLSAGFILEEGFSLHNLDTVVLSMKKAAEAAGVFIVAGDTKVVDKGKADGIFINTTGVGVVSDSLRIGPDQVKATDVILLSGDLGRHGITIMSKRHGLELTSAIESDCAPLHHLVANLIDQQISLRCLRDLTRGGLATALNEIAEESQVQFVIEETSLPVRGEVQAACELLGLDPLYLANEGAFIVMVPASDADKALKILSESSHEKMARKIGVVKAAPSPSVRLITPFGTERILDPLINDPLPRIC